ncbi:MAG: ribulose-phosphate 3-epimerase [Bacteroidales bacterium]|nr:ribulose-phosphate 3-epimerase [Bacteroidales bacterium]
MAQRIIAASMLSADFANLGRDVRMINESECDWFHLDIMDGVFVPNISYGFPVVKAIADSTSKPLDAHLMIVNPDRYVERFAELGVSWISIHYEACTHLHRTLALIRSCGMKAGVALNPHTPVAVLKDILCECDYALIMSVNPGFGGQKFIERTYSKIVELKQIIDSQGVDCKIQVDGGVTLSNITPLSDAGCDIFVAGNTIFSASDPVKMISDLKKQMQRQA